MSAQRSPEPLVAEALRQALDLYLAHCEKAQALEGSPTGENKLADDAARKRYNDSVTTLKDILDAAGYDVRMNGPSFERDGKTFIAIPKVEREVVKWGYAQGEITRKDMLAWFEHNQEQGWLRSDKQEIPE